MSDQTQGGHSSGNGFAAQLQEIGRRAKGSMMEGAVTPGYTLDRETAIKVLNDAVATEIVCWLRYLGHAYAARGIHSDAVVAEFREHARDEEEHLNMLAARISQLGGTANFDPTNIGARSHSDFATSERLGEMIRQDLEAERVAIDIYREMITWFGNQDPTTRRILEKILAQEEEHADDMASLLTTFVDDART
jgi:bacterioferritin